MLIIKIEILHNENKLVNSMHNIVKKINWIIISILGFVSHLYKPSLQVLEKTIKIISAFLTI